MTIEAARILDISWANHLLIASAGERRICTEGRMVDDQITVYDHSKTLVKSLLPLTYNYSHTMRAITEALWERMIATGEVLAFDHPFVKTVLIDHNTPDPYRCDTCGWDERSINHYKECG